ncbi:MAG: Eco57I restriction-modification methylase domain-containing protein [Candidatus Hodarchaeota archaeon]
MQKQSLQEFLSYAENLVKSFENNRFLKKDVYRNLGIIYTPNQVVDYIVSNVLRLYFEELLNTQNIDQHILNFETLIFNLTKNQDLKKELGKRIKNIKILDPACGSGRFLVSAAEKLYYIYEILNPEKSKFDLRRKIIEKHLYGIEIEKSAYNISKMSLILWLFTEDLTHFPFNEIKIKNVIFENLDHIINHFNIKLHIYNLDFLFEDNSDQFDIIIGNPPYIENKKIKNNYKKKLIKKFLSAYRLFDISIIFIEKSVELLKQNEGLLTFLTTNKFLSADYGIKIRNLIINNTVLKEIINISSIPVFKKISAYPIIFSLLKKNPNKDNLVSIKKFDNLQDMNKNNLSYSNKLPQLSIKSLPANTIPISGKLNLLNYLYENFKPMAAVIDDLKIKYRPFGFLNYSKYFDNISERKENDSDLLLIGTGNVGKYHIKFDKHIRIAKKDFKISYFKYSPSFEKIWNNITTEKLIFREIAKDLTWVYDPGLFTNITGLYFLTIPSFSTDQLFSLLAIMNSNTIDLSFKSLFSSLHMSGGYLRFNGSFVRRLPLPKEFPLSLSYLGKINQSLSQIQYGLNSIDSKSFNNLVLNQLSRKNIEVRLNINFYKNLTDSLVTLLYFKKLYSKSNIQFDLLNELLYSKHLIPNIPFKYVLPRFNLPKFEIYQYEELYSIFSKINNFYKKFSQNDKLLTQMENITYNNLSLKG